MTNNENDWSPNTNEGTFSNSESHYTQEPTGSSGMAIASLVLGILAVLTSCCACTGIFFGGLSIIFGLLSKGGAPKMDSKATIGVIISSIALFISILVIILFAVNVRSSGGMESFMDEFTEEYSNYSDYENTL